MSRLVAAGAASAALLRGSTAAEQQLGARRRTAGRLKRGSGAESPRKRTSPQKRMSSPSVK